MASWRLTAMASSQLHKLRGALIPVPAIDAGAKNSRSVVYGFPGTVRIPAPPPFPDADKMTVAFAQTGWIGIPSSYFSWWTPSIYYVPAVERAPVSRISDNQMPVPAVDPRGLPAVVMPGPMMMGQTQVSTPRLAPKYMNPQSRRKVSR